MNISHYFDTSALLKLYNEETGSRAAIAIARQTTALPLAFIGEMELRNSLRVLRGRDRLLPDELNLALDYIDCDLADGRLQRLRLDPRLIERQSFEISEQYSSAFLCRTLDILHIATALVANIPHFVTCDKRQSLLARKVGLNVEFIDLATIQEI